MHDFPSFAKEPTYEDILKQDELLNSFPSDDASHEEVSAWIAAYWPTITTAPPKLTQAMKQWNGYQFSHLSSRQILSHFGNERGEHFIEATTTGKMMRKIAKARKTKEHFDDSAATWAKESKHFDSKIGW